MDNDLSAGDVAAPQDGLSHDLRARPTAQAEFAPDGTFLSACDEFLRLTRYERNEILGRAEAILLWPEDHDDPQHRALWELLRSGEVVQRDLRRMTRDGREIWLQASYDPVLSEEGEVTAIRLIATDVTAKRRQAANHENILAAISRSTAMVEFALDGTIIAANANFASLLGYDVEELLGRNHREFVAAEIVDSPAYGAFWNRLRAGEFVQAEFPRLARSGRTIWLQATYNPVVDTATGRPTKVVKIATDITERMQESAEANRLALLDPLTGISNRRGFDLALGAALEDFRKGVEPISLILLDVDHFKPFNDIYGHQIGDRCLRRVAKAIERSVRRPESLVARYGGEEFAVLLPNTTRHETARVAEAARAAIQHLAIDHPGNADWGTVTASFGHVTFEAGRDERFHTATELVTAADRALYTAKRLGRNHVADAVDPSSKDPYAVFRMLPGEEFFGPEPESAAGRQIRRSATI
ncbi:sensor domain-containing diguanylate cyclase [Jiella avicenniae]|uniref:diguanylate cyclase n=1 Tax=Jiella avicenniae TaxID=2907202 RepID=A0A9X1P081_9HYPH|nr:diguanylate cyclase [Jiella avicenniae]MCE7029055.1 diguanylate cyclase [Jiella avicenniae]